MTHPNKIAVVLVTLVCFVLAVAVCPVFGTVAKKEQTSCALIVTGQDHPGHKWRQTAPVLAELLQQDSRMQVRAVEDPHFLDSSALYRYNVVVLHFMNWEVSAPGPAARENLRRFVHDGGGLVLIHFACGAFQDWPEFRNLAGRIWNPKLRGHDPRGPFRVDIVDNKHSITQGLQSFETDDELYTCLAGDRPIRVLATAKSKVDGKDYPMAFVFNYGKGLVFHSLLGHDVKAISNPDVSELFRRGCAWASGLQPVPPKKVVLIAGKSSHGPGQHEHGKGVLLLKECLDNSSNVKGIETHVVLNEWPADPTVLDDADAILIYSDGLDKHPLARSDRLEKIRKLINQGVGLLCVHYAVAPPEKCEAEFLDWIGGYWEKDYSKNPISRVKVSPAMPKHPICRGWKPFTAKDEFYYRIRFRQDDKRLIPVMTAMLPKENPEREILAWAVQRKDGGRGFGFTGGHFHSNWNIEPFRKMVLNAILWTAKVEVPEDGVQSMIN